MAIGQRTVGALEICYALDIYWCQRCHVY